MNKKNNKTFVRHKKAWVVSVDMGYGHERTAYALRDIAEGGIITANNYSGIPAADRRTWNQSREFYETVSRFFAVPVVGRYIFETYDHLQEIKPFYPRRDLSRPTMQLKQMYWVMAHKGLGRDLIERLREKPLPFVSTFFLPAFAAEFFGYPGEIYCVICDTDVSRAWAPLDPKKSRIKYFAPNGRVVERLKLYGVREENIFLTGFPIPKELVDGPNSSALKRDLSCRLNNLDPNGVFQNQYNLTLRQRLGKYWEDKPKKRSLTLTFSVGGAGAQWRLATQIMSGLRTRLAKGDITLNLEAGTHKDIRDKFIKSAQELNLSKQIGKNLNINYYKSRTEYFEKFTVGLKKTDILWTKPSEQSFYTGAGIPIIIAPPIGSQEDFNSRWLQAVGGGIPQHDPRYINEWLFDWVESGGLAKMAWNGYIEAPTHGAYRIQSVITDEKFPLEKLPLIV